MNTTVRLAGRIGLLSLATALCCAAGCRHQDLARQRIELKQQRLARTVRMAEELERKRPPRFNRTIGMIERDIQHDAELTRENGDEIRALWNESWRRWVERQPLYRSEARRLFGGKPDQIEPTAIIMFY